jgi:RNA polymerase sigma factor (sigma-70 family)
MMKAPKARFGRGGYVSTQLDDRRPDLLDREEDSKSDMELVAAIQSDPLDLGAMDILIGRYWARLFARCRVLASNYEDACDLAQETWCRILRARHRLRSDGNFPAYLMTIAMNLWRDRQRAELRAGLMASRELISLEAELQCDGEMNARWSDLLPDPTTLHGSEKSLLKLSLDEALAKLNPLLRDVLVSRFVAGESCAEIGVRYGRTEQTITGWIRKAVQEIKMALTNGDAVSGIGRATLGI